MKPVPHVQFIKSKGNMACKTTWFRGKLACDGLDTFSDFDQPTMGRLFAASETKAGKGVCSHSPEKRRGDQI